MRSKQKYFTYKDEYQTLCWMNSYSLNSKLRAKIGNSLSKEFTAHLAIGQETILGPKTILTYFNYSDRPTKKANSFNFADDKQKATIVSLDTRNLQEKIYQ